MKKVMWILIIFLAITKVRALNTEVDFANGVIYYNLEKEVVGVFTGEIGTDFVAPDKSIFDTYEDRKFIGFSEDIKSIPEGVKEIYPRYDRLKLTLSVKWMTDSFLNNIDKYTKETVCEIMVFTDENGGFTLNSKNVDELIKNPAMLNYAKNNGAMVKTPFDYGKTYYSDDEVIFQIRKNGFYVEFVQVLDGVEELQYKSDKTVIAGAKLDYLPKEIPGYAFNHMEPSSSVYDFSKFEDPVYPIGPYKYKLYYDNLSTSYFPVDFYFQDTLLKHYEIKEGDFLPVEATTLSTYDNEYYTCTGFDKDLSLPIYQAMKVNVEYDPNDMLINFYYDENNLILSNYQKYQAELVYPDEKEILQNEKYQAFISFPYYETVEGNMDIYANLDLDIYNQDKIYQVNIYERFYEGTDLLEEKFLEKQAVKYKQDLKYKVMSYPGYNFWKTIGESETITNTGDFYICYQKQPQTVKLTIAVEKGNYYVVDNVVFNHTYNNELTKEELESHLLDLNVYKGLKELTYDEDILGKKYVKNETIAHYQLKRFWARFYAYQQGNYFSLDKLEYSQIIEQNNIQKPQDQGIYKFIGFDKPFTAITANIEYYAVYQSADNKFYVVDKDDYFQLKEVSAKELKNMNIFTEEIGYEPITKNVDYPKIKAIDIRKKGQGTAIKLIFYGDIDFNKYHLEAVSYNGQTTNDFTSYSVDKKTIFDQQTNWIEVVIARSYAKKYLLNYFDISAIK